MIGELDRRIIIIQPILTQGTSGEDKPTGWERIDVNPDVWAEETDTRGSTLVQADRVVFSQTVTWKMRHRTDITVKMRIVDEQSQVYEIIGINKTKKRNRFIEVTTNLLDNTYWT